MPTLKQVNKALALELPGVKLVRGNGYYYVHSDDDRIALQIAGLYTSSIPVFHVSHQSIETWVNDVRNVLKDSDRYVTERRPVVINRKPVS